MFDYVGFFIVSEAKNAYVTFVEKPHMKIISFLKQKHWYLFGQGKLLRVKLWLWLVLILWNVIRNVFRNIFWSWFITKSEA